MKYTIIIALSLALYSCSNSSNSQGTDSTATINTNKNNDSINLINQINHIQSDIDFYNKRTYDAQTIDNAYVSNFQHSNKIVEDYNSPLIVQGYVNFVSGDDLVNLTDNNDYPFASCRVVFKRSPSWKFEKGQFVEILGDRIEKINYSGPTYMHAKIVNPRLLISPYIERLNTSLKNAKEKYESQYGHSKDWDSNSTQSNELSEVKKMDQQNSTQSNELSEVKKMNKQQDDMPISGNYKRDEGDCTPFALIILNSNKLEVNGRDEFNGQIKYTEIYVSESDNPKIFYLEGSQHRAFFEVGFQSTWLFHNDSKTCVFRKFREP